MLIVAGALLASMLATYLIIVSSHRHAHLSHDEDQSSPQKFHSQPVPRVGGLGLFIGFTVGTALAVWLAEGQSWPKLALLLLACSLPTFLAGLAEDVTKSVSPRRRLVFTAASALAAYFVLDAVVLRSGWALLDGVLATTAVSLALTVCAVTGVTNAVNIIDGFNGLASMCGLLMLCAIGFVAWRVDSTAILYTSAILGASVVGFFVFNFPKGLIFFGDGGAYLLGFGIAELCILLVHQSPQVSPLFGVLVCAYPIMETLFSIYRKRFLRKMSPAVPDGVHLHMLVYKRLMRWEVGACDDRQLTLRNSFTSPYLWVLSLLSIVPAVIWWDNTLALLIAGLAFSGFYVLIYWRIVRFRMPRWAVVTKDR